MKRIEIINGIAVLVAILAGFGFMCAEDASLGWYITTGSILVISGTVAIITGSRRA